MSKSNSNENKIWGSEFIAEYVETGNHYSFENDHLHIGTALGLLSQAVGDSYFYIGDGKQTTRVHPLMIQGSGTGKDPAFDFAKAVARIAGMDLTDVNDVTNAGLIGTIQGEDPTPGLAEEADIIGFREATTLFRSANSDHSQNLGENLNQILDGKEIRRNMAGGKLVYQPSCTLIGTTYPPSDLDLKRLMTNGTLARFFYFFRPIGEDFRWGMCERLLQESVWSADDEERLNRVHRLGKTLEEIEEFFADGEEFTISISVSTLRVRDRLEPIYNEFDDTTRELVDPAINRYTLHFLRISCLMAALDECSTTVGKEHAEIALKFIEESWRNLLEFFEHHFTSESQKNKRIDETEITILRALLAEDELTQSELAEITGLSTRTIRNKETPLKMMSLVKTSTEGREKVYRLNREGVA